jgi:3-oxoacyl-[acyl-carrier-protein] synthase II
MGLRSPIGNTIEQFTDSLMNLRSGIRYIPEWEKIKRLRTKLAGVCEIEGEDKTIPRGNRRSMGRVSLLAALSAMDAVRLSGLEEEEIASPHCGISYGSTAGSTHEQVDRIAGMLPDWDLTGVPPSFYLKCMSHTCAGNLSVLFHARGPVISSCTACTSGSQGVGFGYEAIRSGRADIMIAGGAEEIHFLYASVFDLMLATSSGYNDRPEKTPRPFDADRDGLVVAEGAGTLILEEYDRARRRGAPVLAEVKGFWTNGNGSHLTNSDPESMQECMTGALRDAGVSPEEVRHVNAHATATIHGDLSEALATHRVYGEDVPVTAIKSYMGHTMGASGALETIASVVMMRDGFLCPTLNLETVDPDLSPLNHVRGEVREQRVDLVVNNSFAFGGVNTSIVLKSV